MKKTNKLSVNNQKNKRKTNKCRKMRGGEEVLPAWKKAILAKQDPISQLMIDSGKIDLSGKELKDGVIKKIVEILNNSNNNITSINLAGNNITDIGAKSLVESLKNNKKLESLDLNLSNNLITNYYIFSALYDNEKIIINLENNKLTAKDLSLLKKRNDKILEQRKNLEILKNELSNHSTTLNFENKYLGDECIVLITPFLENNYKPPITSINFSNTNIYMNDEKKSNALLNVLNNNTTLKLLNLSYNNIDPKNINQLKTL
jgi:hypothetical protein